MLTSASFLKGIAGGAVFGRAVSYSDLTCCAVGVAIVIYAIFYVAFYPLDMLLANIASIFSVTFSVTHSFKTSLIRILILFAKIKYLYVRIKFMAVYVIADLHLATADSTKSMEIFGKRWTNYIDKLKSNWQHLVAPDDTVIIPGDISWALTTEQALNDLVWLDSLPGRKILMKGNHDFWWSTVSKLNAFFKANGVSTLELLNNNALEAENYIIAGSRGWFTDSSLQNLNESVDYQKIINREAIRLRMSFEAAEKIRKQSGKEIIAFMHFPPVWGEFVCQPFIDALKDYNIKKCFFGHIHGSYACSDSFEYASIRFCIISADFLDFIPRIV